MQCLKLWGWSSMVYSWRQKSIIRNIGKGKVNNFPTLIRHYCKKSIICIKEEEIEKELLSKFDEKRYNEICSKLNEKMFKLQYEDIDEESNMFNGVVVRDFRENEKKEIQELLKNPKIKRTRYTFANENLKINVLDNKVYFIKDDSIIRDYKFVINNLEKMSLGNIHQEKLTKEMLCCCFGLRQEKTNKADNPFEDFQINTNKYQLYSEMYGSEAIDGHGNTIFLNGEMIKDYKDIITSEIDSDIALKKYIKRHFHSFEEYSFKKNYWIAIGSLIISILAVIISMCK